MVSSAVYGFESEIEQICSILSNMGYRVLNSYIGTIKVHPGFSNLDNCLKAVEECDLFLGVIRPYCGTGNIDDKNITFEEMKKAVELNKPYDRETKSYHIYSWWIPNYIKKYTKNEKTIYVVSTRTSVSEIYLPDYGIKPAEG